MFENLVDRVVMVELDEEAGAVWQSVVNGDAKWHADQIVKFDLTKEAAIAEISKAPKVCHYQQKAEGTKIAIT